MLQNQKLEIRTRLKPQQFDFIAIKSNSIQFKHNQKSILKKPNIDYYEIISLFGVKIFNVSLKSLIHEFTTPTN